MKKAEISIIAGLCIALAVSVYTDYAHRAKQTAAATLRLHVVAASDCPRDVAVKMKVRDRVGRTRVALLAGADDIDRAVRTINRNMELIHAVASRRIQQAGSEDECVCRVESFYFVPSVRGDMVLPGGEYTALTVRIGSARGHNRWRALYPSFALAGRAEYTQTGCADEEDTGTIYEDENIVIKLKVAQLGRRIKEFFLPSKADKYDRMSG